MPNPGSYTEFTSSKELPMNSESLSQYSVELQAFRKELAEEHKLENVEDLHDLRSLGNIALG